MPNKSFGLRSVLLPTIWGKKVLVRIHRNVFEFAAPDVNGYSAAVIGRDGRHGMGSHPTNRQFAIDAAYAARDAN